jgi:hypothetical protein
MLRSTLLRATAAAALLAASSASVAAAAPEPGFTVGSGCAAQCIEKATVTTTASTAKLVVKTTVPAKLEISVWSEVPSGTPGGLAQNTTLTRTIKRWAPKRATFRNLQPDTTYDIVVRAIDAKGQKASRTGTFRTRKMQTTGIGGPGGLSAGLGCSAECIQRALFSQRSPSGRIAYVDLKTAVDAKLRVIVSRQYGDVGVVSDQSSPGFVRSWKPQVGGLDYGSLYHVSVRATDREGRTSLRRGTFETVSATVLVTLHKIRVLNDGDKIGRGELYFGYWGNEEPITGQGWMKLGSGDWFAPRFHGTSRPGVFFRGPANGDASFRVFVSASECDAVFMSNCLLEATDGEYCGDACAGGTFRLEDVLSGALPGWYGTGASQPAGHDGYFAFQTGSTYVKFLVLATVDVEVEWP